MDAAIEYHVKNRDTESLYEIMTENDDWMFCLDAAEGLALLGDMRGVQFLMDATESDDDDIKAVAQEILNSPEIRRLRDEIDATEKKKRQVVVEEARVRIQQNKKVFRYQTVYLPASYFIMDGAEGGVNIPALDEFGLDGWEVAAYLGHREPTPGVAIGGKLTGGYFLLKKEITAGNLSELEEM